VLLVTFHGGSNGQANAAAYDESGTLVSSSVLEPLPAEAELRGLALVGGGLLWVANGSKTSSAILAYSGSGSSYSGGQPVASYPAVDSLWHPFDFTFSFDPAARRCYVSNQDTNAVARFGVAVDGKSMSPAPLAPALPPEGTFLDGTFVASSDGNLPGVRPTTPIPDTAGGLDVSIKSGKITHSVRGVLWTNGALYVADEPGNVVRVYDINGSYLGCSSMLERPVHLLAADGVLYASAEPGVYSAKLNPDQPASLQFPAQPNIALPGAAGMAFAATGSLYVANRLESKIYAFPNVSSSSAATATSFPVLANPEFLLDVEDG
jgi:hypothetical protein